MKIAIKDKKLQMQGKVNSLRSARQFFVICSFVVLAPMMITNNAFAEINLFQKKPATSEAPKGEGATQSSTLPASQNEVVPSAEAANEPAANVSESLAQPAVAPMSHLEKQAISAVSTTVQSSHFPKILVVDVQGVLLSSAVGKDIKKQFDDKQAAFMKEIEVEEGELKKTEQDLLRQRTVLSQEVFAKKKADFDERMVALNTKFQKNRQILEEAFNLARTDVESKLIEVIKEVKTEQSANLVLPSQQVIMGDDQMDVTGEVLSRFNKKVPSYKVNF